jgi:4-amino-4-deoxy-L-arabinose transferase-like glycosyltransferase
MSWEENRSAGALPSPTQLLVARAAITALLTISLWFYYLAFKKLLPGISALVALILLGLNPLILLHGRRAMSEGVLLMGIALFLWLVTREDRNPWLIGLSLGLSFNAKHSALSLLPAAYLAVTLLPGQSFDLKKAINNILKTSLVFLLVFIFLNPFYWEQPIASLNTGIEARIKLAREQQEDHLGPSNKLGTTISGMILNTYITPIQTEEVGNYLQDTNDSRERYLAIPFHNLGRGLLSGSILLAITLAGFGRSAAVYRASSSTKRNIYLTIFLGTLGICTFTIILIPWQRYVVPLLPFICFWIAAGLSPILQAGLKAIIGCSPDDRTPL